MSHHPLKMRVPIEAPLPAARCRLPAVGHHPLKMRVPIEAPRPGVGLAELQWHHPLKMRVPIEADRIWSEAPGDHPGITL